MLVFRNLLPALILSCVACAAPAAERRTDGPAGPDALRERIAGQAAEARGTVGVAAIHLESGERVALHGSERFPMASVYKLPIALAVLHRVDRRELRLDSLITIPPDQFAPHYSPLAEEAAGEPVSLTLERLLELMLGGSDNTASDVLLRLVGGPEAVTRRLRELGIAGVRVDRTERELALDQSGLGAWPADEPWSREAFARRSAAVPAEEVRRAEARFLADPRDTATPEGMAELLAVVHRGAGLSAENRARLLRIMTETPTGRDRLRGLLPPGTPVAHKTGTFGSGMATNDVGLITLAGGGGHLAVAVFIKGSEADIAQRERAIAEIARSLYDHFAPGDALSPLPPRAPAWRRGAPRRKPCSRRARTPRTRC